MSDQKNSSSTGNTDTDSSVIFVGESKNIKSNAEVHPEHTKFGKHFVHFVPETPTSSQTGRKRRKILHTSIPDSQQQQNKSYGKEVINSLIYF